MGPAVGEGSRTASSIPIPAGKVLLEWGERLPPEPSEAAASGMEHCSCLSPPITARTRAGTQAGGKHGGPRAPARHVWLRRPPSPRVEATSPSPAPCRSQPGLRRNRKHRDGIGTRGRLRTGCTAVLPPPTPEAGRGRPLAALGWNPDPSAARKDRKRSGAEGTVEVRTVPHGAYSVAGVRLGTVAGGGVEKGPGLAIVSVTYT